MKTLSEKEFKIEFNQIITYGDNDIILDNEDINIITKNKDLLTMTIAEYSGPYAAQEAIKSAILDFEENMLPITEADGILVYFKMNTNHPIMELAEAMEIIHDKYESIYPSNDLNVIFGVSCDDSMKEDCVKASVFISYLKEKNSSYANNYITESPL